MTAQNLDISLLQALNKLSLAMRQDHWQESAKFGLKPNQVQILQILQSRSVLQLKDLAMYLGVTMPTVSDAIKALQSKGLVHKTVALHDSRAIQIELTDQGREVCGQFRQWTDVTAAMVGSLSVEERKQFLQITIKMIKKLEDEGQISRSRMCISCIHFEKDRESKSTTPHYCRLLQSPLSVGDLRMDCKEHQNPDSGNR